jgi:hypothetical protein
MSRLRILEPPRSVFILRSSIVLVLELELVLGIWGAGHLRET